MGRFEVSRKGLSKQLDRLGKAWMVFEPLQNALDEDGVANIKITLEPIPHKHLARLMVEDDSPEGFMDLSHAWTLFAESYKGPSAEKRGRFNIGEKLLIAVAEYAQIVTTKGTVTFAGDERVEVKQGSDRGSTIIAHLPITRPDIEEIGRAVRSVIIPPSFNVTFNGEKLLQRNPVTISGGKPAEFFWTLPTETTDENGYLRPTARVTKVVLYQPVNGEKASIYEMGIPVVETDDKYHVDIQQRVPLNWQRDNVTPSYLKTIRALTLNAMHEHLETEDFTRPWVAQAVTDKRVEVSAVGSYLDAKYSKERVTYDPTNPESKNLAEYRGYTVIHGRSEDSATWEKIREGNLAPSASQVFPTKTESTTADVLLKDWTPGINNLVLYVKDLTTALLGKPLPVRIVNDSKMGILASCNEHGIMFNIGRLGWRFFNDGPTEEVNNLILHELGHALPRGDDHRGQDYHDNLTHLGAKMVALALSDPELFKKYLVKASSNN